MRERRHFAYSLSDLGVSAACQGDLERARECLRESLSIFTELDDKNGVRRAVFAYGPLFAAEGHPERAVRLYAAVLAQSRTLHTGPIRDRFDRYEDATQKALGPELLAAALAAGQTMSLAQAVAYTQQAEH